VRPFRYLQISCTVFVIFWYVGYIVHSRCISTFLLVSGPDISSLLAEILNITLSRRLPILNSAKTFSLALWILRSQRLPQGLLSPRASDIFSVLRRALHIQPFGQQFIELAGDGLKVWEAILGYGFLLTTCRPYATF
jgi:hypothetical protein